MIELTLYSEHLNSDDFEKIKTYLKVDTVYEDDLISDFLDSVALELVDAIDSTKKVDDFLDEPRFHLAVKKQAKEEYEHRGLSADTMRYSLANGVLNIIHQLRAKGVVLDDYT
ncbi:hypothetical protein IGK74_002384 [Enterococcus sp. AZ150]|uniref:head-tail connector protein n=1 Tax=Enterococcus sp. AZ150 TaxID=2774866 RepID=UPI003F21A2D6